MLQLSDYPTPQAAGLQFQIFQSNGQWRWYLVGLDDRIIAASIIGYARRSECNKAIKLVMEASNASIVHVVYKDRLPGEPISDWEARQLTDGVRLALGVA